MPRWVADQPVVPKKRAAPAEERAEQNSVLGESTRLHPRQTNRAHQTRRLAAPAREEAGLTNVVQYVDEELLRLAFKLLRNQAAPRALMDKSYEDCVANVDQKLKACTHA